jgi:hypothetical protein
VRQHELLRANMQYLKGERVRELAGIVANKHVGDVDERHARKHARGVLLLQKREFEQRECVSGEGCGVTAMVGQSRI